MRRWLAIGVAVLGFVPAGAGFAGDDLRPKPRPFALERKALIPADPHAPLADAQFRGDGALPFVFPASGVPKPRVKPDASGATVAAPEPGVPEAPAAASPALAFAPAPPAPRPPRRPAAFGKMAAPEPAGMTRLGVLAQSLRPAPRPANLMRARAAPAAPKTAKPQAAALVRPAPGLGPLAGPKGTVCGVAAIQGQQIAPIVGRVNGCGIANPVRITQVAGVRLTQPATLNCTAAQALNTWVERGLKPAFGRTGGGVVAITVPAHYACRTRNHKKGAKISEHGKGNAVDISIVHLANGQAVSVLRGWRSEFGAALKAAHRAACGIFSTTLGPGSDGMHEDHFHFDVAQHRSGSYCR